MKTKHLKAAAAAVSLLIASSPALATSTGAQTLGGVSTAVDVFTFICPPGTVSARANVQDTVTTVNVGAMMRVILTNAGGVPALQAEDTDPLGGLGEGGLTSPTVAVSTGAGFYKALFLKTAVGVESYVGTITCNNGVGAVINNPALFQLQNQ